MNGSKQARVFSLVLALTMLPAAAGSVLAQQDPETGVANIANAKGIAEAPYGTVRDWNVVSGKLGSKFAYCAAETTLGGQVVRLGFDAGQWQIGIPIASKKDYEGQLVVDGRKRMVSGHSDGKWTFVWLGLEELEWVGKGKTMVLEIGKASLDYELKSTAATITKIEECVNRKGVAPKSAAGAAPK